MDVRYGDGSQWLDRASAPIENADKMPHAFAKITDTATGDSVVYDTGENWDGEFGIVHFDWFENNKSCDCNRALFFEDAGGITDYEGGCGDSRFHVVMIDGTGAVLHSDWPTSSETAPAPSTAD